MLSPSDKNSPTHVIISKKSPTELSEVSIHACIICMVLNHLNQ